ncbi:MAG: glycosyltransferase [Candidatus Lloydbacteria bacterium RIFCSPHIGHO2_02_FULL_50_13]|uniref:Glycosyltransferase n=1 Tax=Candidatus Lloydbacteria bacterium RIFCSPHIGHO2_02_FULL_50_13 TaxID=1798661 RepID=A0A1G2D5G3_9BACT|nr:MAG: glycosyltransferase [Candidatus Lloydbacteria bacterium RIFCSPHIGHO2_02_FULL_50_13]
MNTDEKTHIGAVVPVYGCELCLPELYLRLSLSLQKINPNFEVIFVNDGSLDNAWPVIKDLASKDKRVRGLNLSRNFGQHPAISAGLSASTAEWVVVMDCDLQDQPEEIEKLYRKAREGFDAVVASRIERQDGYFRKVISSVFYGTLSYLTDTKHDPTVANFGIYSRKTIDAILNMGERSRYFPLMVRWVGFKTATLPVEHAKRKSGKTSYSLKKMLDLGIDVVLAFSDKPLRLVVKFGIIISFLALMYVVFVVLRALDGIHPVLGWASLIASIWLIFGMLTMILGIISLYVGKTFDETKKRPIYIVKEKI